MHPETITIDQAMDRFRLLRRNFDEQVDEQVNADKELAALLKATKRIRFCQSED